MKRFLAPFAALVLWFGPLNAQVYQDVASSVNINFNNQALTANGGGVSFEDFDGDGLDDITIASGMNNTLQFYKNNGNGFTKLPSLVNITFEAQHVIWVDYDNDGDKDLYVSGNLSENKLFRNNGTTYTDVSASAGLAVTPTETYGVCWGDINNDGWLDFYEANQPNIGTGRNNLYISNGAGGFSNIAMAAGVDDSTWFTFAGAFFDYNKDGLQDLFVSNDRKNPSSLYQNNGDTTFANVSVQAGTNLFIDGMGIAIADYDNNGFLDIYVCNTDSGNILLQNTGNNSFVEVGSAMGVTLGAESWGTNFFDADHDGDLDLYVSDILFTSARPSNRYFRNDGNIFTQPSLFIGDTLKGFSNAIGDFNNDGFYDIVSPNKYPFALQLWESGGISGTNWIKVKLQGVVSNRDGVGSWIEVYAGTDVFHTYTQCGSSYLGQNSSTRIIGLGNNTAVDSIRVVWLSGHIDTWHNPATKQVHLLVEGSGMNPKVTVNGPLHFCKGDSINLSLEASPGFDTYLWSNGDTTRSIHPRQPGAYSVKVTNEFGLTDSTNAVIVDVDSLQISAQAIADTNLSGLGLAFVDIAYGTPPYTFLWDDPLNQTSDTATGLVAGTYQVWVTDSAGCMDSATVSVDNTSGLNEVFSTKLDVYPNPVDDVLKIKTGIAEPLTLELSEINGRILITQEFFGKAEFSTKSMGAGVYMLKIYTSSGLIFSKPIIKNTHD